MSKQSILDAMETDLGKTIRPSSRKIKMDAYPSFLDESLTKTGEVSNKPKAGLYTITPEIIFACHTQPWKLNNFAKNKGIVDATLSRQRSLYYLINCLMYYPKDLESIFNIEVPPPYDANTRHFIKYFAREVNDRIRRDGEIDTAEIPKIQEEIYRSYTYSTTLAGIRQEMDDNREYVAFILNAGNKITISEKDFKSVNRAVRTIKERKPSLFDRSRNEENNHSLICDVVCNKGVPYILSASAPAFVLGKDGLYVEMAIYTDELYKESASDLDTYKDTFMIWDLAILSQVIKTDWPDLKATIRIRIIDSYGNWVGLDVSDATRNRLAEVKIKEIRDILTSLSTGVDMNKYLDKRLENSGVITI